MTEKTKTFLDIDEIVSLLPDDFVFNKEKDKAGRNAFITKSGETLPIHNSKLYPNESFWYNALIDFYAESGIKRVCLTCGNDGILLLPIEILKEYTKVTNWKKQAKGKSYFIRIKRNGNSFRLHGYEEGVDNTGFDISEFYIPKM